MKFKKKKPPMVTTKIPKEASAAAVGSLLGVTVRRVRQIGAEAGIEPISRGRYPVATMIQAALEVARRERAGAAEREARARVIAARAREIEVRTAREEGNLIPTEEAVTYTQIVVGTLISALEGLPVRFTRDLDERRRLEVMIEEIRGQVAAVIEEHGPEYRSMPDNP